MSEVKKVIMLGNEAIARGAYEAGVKVSAAYPGTPSTEISENLSNTKTIFTVNGLRMRRSQQKLRLEHLSQVSGLCLV